MRIVLYEIVKTYCLRVHNVSCFPGLEWRLGGERSLQGHVSHSVSAAVNTGESPAELISCARIKAIKHSILHQELISMIQP